MGHAKQLRWLLTGLKLIGKKQCNKLRDAPRIPVKTENQSIMTATYPLLHPEPLPIWCVKVWVGPEIFFWATPFLIPMTLFPLPLSLLLSDRW